MSGPLDGYSRDRHVDFPFHPGEMPPLFGATEALLVVDDDPATAALLAAMLEHEGYRCAIASDAEEAMEMLNDDEFAVALVDIMMPGEETGLELVERALSVHPFLAVVMVTGVDDPHIAELALESGAFGYLVKPFIHTEVVVAVSNAGRRRCLAIESAVYRRRLETHLEEQAADLDDALRQLKELHERD